jgi:hypothetical protein
MTCVSRSRLCWLARAWLQGTRGTYAPTLVQTDSNITKGIRLFPFVKERYTGLENRDYGRRDPPR